MTKADHCRRLLQGGKLNSFEIAAKVGCHPGFVRAIKVRVLNPERERLRDNDPRYSARKQRYKERKRQEAHA